MIWRLILIELVLAMGILAIPGHASADAVIVELPEQNPVLKDSHNFPEDAMAGSELAWPRLRWLEYAVDQETSSDWRMAAVKYYLPSGFDISIVEFNGNFDKCVCCRNCENVRGADEATKCHPVDGSMPSVAGQGVGVAGNTELNQQVFPR